MAGLIVLAIPGAGPIIVGSAMATILTGLAIGAAGGGLVGAFKNLGISHDEAGLYEEAVRRGCVFVAAQTDDALEPEVIRVLNETGGAEIRDDAEKWRAPGWTHPYPSDSSIATPYEERHRHVN